MNLLTANVLLYNLQMLAIVAVAAVAATVLEVRVARIRLIYWRVVLLMSLLVPFLASTTQPPADTFLRNAARVGVAAAAGGVPAHAFAWLPAVLLTGAVVRAMWLGMGLLRLRRLRSVAAVATFEADVQAAARDVAPGAEFLWNDAATQPSTFGFWRPTVLLPRRMADLPSDVQRAVLLHETWHIARHDWLWLVAEELVQTAFWFHPAVWWTIDQIQLAREQTVDALVVSTLDSRRAYMKAIVAFADVLPPAAFASAFLRRRHLKRRVEAIATLRRDSLCRSLAVATALVVLTSASALEASRLLPLWQTGAEPQDYTAGNGVTLPKVVKELRPQYTPQALAARIEGSVLMACVVAINGEPEGIRVTRSLDATLGLDEAAVAALREWRFKPGTRQGQPVRVRIDVEMTFTLK